MEHKSIKRLFLVDGIGAVASSVCLGIVLVKFQGYIGMPINVLYILALIAGIFALYSWKCYFASFISISHLKIIGIANLMYSFATYSLVVIHYEKLTQLGVAYFMIEICILWILVYNELGIKGLKRMLQKNSK